MTSQIVVVMTEVVVVAVVKLAMVLRDDVVKTLVVVPRVVMVTLGGSGGEDCGGVDCDFDCATSSNVALLHWWCRQWSGVRENQTPTAVPPFPPPPVFSTRDPPPSPRALPCAPTVPISTASSRSPRFPPPPPPVPSRVPTWVLFLFSRSEYDPTAPISTASSRPPLPPVSCPAPLTVCPPVCPPVFCSCPAGLSMSPRRQSAQRAVDEPWRQSTYTSGHVTDSSTTLLIHVSQKVWENVLFELGSERVERLGERAFWTWEWKG